MPDPNASPGTVISSRAVRAGAEARFECWADRLQHAAKDAPGYLGAMQLRQTQGLQHFVFRFASKAEAAAWRDGEAFVALGREADAFSAGRDQVHSGDPARFELPSDNAAVGWKRFVTTWLAVFPVLLAISTIMRLLLGGLPPAIQLVPSSLILTAILQWVILPRLQRWSRAWLLKDTNGDLRTN